MTIIKNVQSGELFPTKISLLTLREFKKITKKNGWHFDWTVEFEHPVRKVYKLTIADNPIVQGVISLEIKPDHVYIHLIESSPSNVGRHKVYSAVPLNLLAYACKISFIEGGEGCVKFISEPELIGHYTISWGAVHLGKRLMMINPDTAMKLINSSC